MKPIPKSKAQEKVEEMVNYLSKEAFYGWKRAVAYDAEVAFNTVTRVIQGKSDNPLVIQAMEKMYNEYQNNQWKDQSKVMDLLNEFCLWLEDQGYMDTDWRAEEPYAIDEFMKQRESE